MFFRTTDLTVGYFGKPLISGIDIAVESGKILTLIGPNGSGKSTILKTVTKQLEKLGGVVFIGKKELSSFRDKELAKTMSVMLTDRIRPELMTCFDVVVMGRYPYTNHFGMLSEEDTAVVTAAMEIVGASDLADRPFSDISDGQRQRIMLARAICQQPNILVLDEPTSFLDIRHKIELLGILRTMAEERNVAVLMSLHEIDLAAKISDYLVCVKGDVIEKFGTPREILNDDIISWLYDLENGSYNTVFGSIELKRPSGVPRVFVIAGGGIGIPVFRDLQRIGIAFYTGVIPENDVDYHVAVALAAETVSIPPFSACTEEAMERALRLMDETECIIDPGAFVSDFNPYLSEIRAHAERTGKPVLSARDFEARRGEYLE